jgi:hypothetical protein
MRLWDRRQNTNYCSLHFHSRENLKSYLTSDCIVEISVHNWSMTNILSNLHNLFLSFTMDRFSIYRTLQPFWKRFRNPPRLVAQEQLRNFKKENFIVLLNNLLAHREDKLRSQYTLTVLDVWYQHSGHWQLSALCSTRHIIGEQLLKWNPLVVQERKARLSVAYSEILSILDCGVYRYSINLLLFRAGINTLPLLPQNAPYIICTVGCCGRQRIFCQLVPA